MISFKKYLKEAFSMKWAMTIRKKLDWNSWLKGNNGRVYLELGSARELKVDRKKVKPTYKYPKSQLLLPGFKKGMLIGDITQFKKVIKSKFSDKTYTGGTDYATIKAALLLKGYEIKDYLKGLAVKKGTNRVVRIGKLLTPELKRYFDNDPFRSDTKKSKSNKKIVVISSHSLDIGSAANRSWFSCLQINDAYIDSLIGYDRENDGNIWDTGAGGIFCDIQAGSLVAYLIDSDDLNIENPHARIMLRPYSDALEVGMRDSEHESTILFMSQEDHGSAAPIFRSTIEKWLNKKYKGREGIFVVHPKVYSGGHPTEIKSAKLDKRKVKKKELLGKKKTMNIYIEVQLMEMGEDPGNVDLENISKIAVEGIWQKIEKITNETKQNLAWNYDFNVSVEANYSSQEVAFRTNKITNKTLLVIDSEYQFGLVKTRVTATIETLRALKKHFHLTHNDY